MTDDSRGVGAFAAYLRLSARSGLARVRDAAYALRSSPSSPGDLPGRGVVAVEGRVEAADELLRSPVTGTRAVLARYRLAAVEPDDGRAWVIRDRVVAVPFHVADDDGRVLVDAVPRQVDEELSAGPRSRGRAAYADATLAFPSGAETTREVPADDLSSGDPLAGFVSGGFPAGSLLRFTERRFEPGDSVSVVGHRLPGDHVRPDVGNVAGLRSPFRISG